MVVDGWWGKGRAVHFRVFPDGFPEILLDVAYSVGEW